MQGSPHDNALVELTGNGETSRHIRIDLKNNGVTPTLFVELPARPENEEEPVEKKIVRFHFTIYNLWN